MNNGSKNGERQRNWEKEIYALQDGNGDLIGVDRNSGGYPWVPEGIIGVWFANHVDQWMQTFGKFGFMNGKSYKLVKVKITLEEVK